MKIERQNVGFSPITIRIESADELLAMLAAIGICTASQIEHFIERRMNITSPPANPHGLIIGPLYRALVTHAKAEGLIRE